MKLKEAGDVVVSGLRDTVVAKQAQVEKLEREIAEAQNLILSIGKMILQKP